MSNPVASDVCPYLMFLPIKNTFFLPAATKCLLTLGCLIVVFFSVGSLPYSIKPPEALVIYK